MLGLGALLSVPLSAGNWPAWRGPSGNGVASDTKLPLQWSEKDNVRWRTELPGPGNSSPIVWGDRVFVSQFVEKENLRALLCFDRATGRLLWRSGVTYTESETTQENNPYCAGTPATDGKHVYVCFGSPGVYAYDFSGKELWHRDLGKLNHVFGTAVSPVVSGDLCFVNFGPDEKARLVALDTATGRIVWEAEPPRPDESERQAETRGFGGRGGFGPGTMLAPQFLAQGDQNGDRQLAKAEFSALAGTWFDKLDSDKSGKLNQEQFTGKLGELLPPPPGADAGPGGGRGGRGGGPARFAGPGLFTAADLDKDGTLTRDEWRRAFDQWGIDWDTDKSGSLSEERIRDGLNAALPRPNFGGPGGRGGGGGGNMGGSWSTPVLVRVDGHDELVVSVPFRVAGLDPKTGRQLWLSKGLGSTVYTTPVWGEGRLVAASGGIGGGTALAIRPGGSGDVTEARREWRLERFKNTFGSGVIHQGHFYTLSQEGIAECLELGSGKSVWQERLSGPGAQTSSWSSMLLADGKIFIPNKSGDVFILRAAPKFEVLAINSVKEPTNASLAAANDELFLRTDKALWCIATPPK